jgi:hypothetical protein
LSRRAFFFPHPLEPKQKRGELNLTGRVAFEVTGRLTGQNESAIGGPFWVMGDGYYDVTSGEIPGVVGSNQDPCIFSAPWGPFHAFYRLDGANLATEKVVADGKHIADSLPETVEPGDVIIYGKVTPHNGKNIKEVWVDTVLVVDSVSELPVAEESTPDPKGVAIYTFALASDKKLPGPGTMAHRYSLSDTLPKGLHETTKRHPHRIIHGRVSDKINAVDKLETSFVPLADRAAGQFGVCPVDKGHMRDDWGPLLDFFEKQVFGKTAGAPHGGWISQFDSFALAETLLKRVVERSGGHQRLRGTVGVPPFTPAAGMKRWDARSARIVPG